MEDLGGRTLITVDLRHAALLNYDAVHLRGQNPVYRSMVLLEHREGTKDPCSAVAPLRFCFRIPTYPP